MTPPAFFHRSSLAILFQRDLVVLRVPFLLLEILLFRITFVIVAVLLFLFLPLIIGAIKVDISYSLQTIARSALATNEADNANDNHRCEKADDSCRRS